jgi:CMP-N-acetylneuraminic acid synthetase
LIAKLTQNRAFPEFPDISAYFAEAGGVEEYTLIRPQDILIVIPVRSGSKGVPNKNIRRLGDKPLMAYSIEAGLNSMTGARVIVSTDSEEYAEIARYYSAEVPFLRPPVLATDDADLKHAIYHLLDRLYRIERYEPKVICYLIATYPFKTARDVFLIAQCIQRGVLSAHTVSKPMKSPFEIFLLKQDKGILLPQIDRYHARRSVKQSFYVSNMSIVVHSIPPWRFASKAYRVVPQFHSLYMDMHRYFNKCMVQHSVVCKSYEAFMTDEIRALDINTEDDFLLAEAVIQEGLFDFQGVIHG